MTLSSTTVGINTPSLRELEWQNFSANVLQHIIDYTIPQYGDMGDDQASDFTLPEIQMNMKRYVNRITSGQRGLTEQLRDAKKLAHYACFLHALLLQMEKDTKTYGS